VLHNGANFGIGTLVRTRGIVMIRRAILAFAALIGLSQTATASVPLFGHVSCALVRFYVAKYSESAAEAWARGHGASDADIAAARHCLHGTNVQTAARSRDERAAPVLVPVTEQKAPPREPTERDPDRGALQVVSVQVQKADPEQVNHDEDPSVHGSIRAKDVEDRSAGDASYEAKNVVASDAKTTTSRPHYVGVRHRARTMGLTAWLKRQWDHLTRPRRSRIALFAFPRSRSYKARSWHHLSGTVPGHGGRA